MQSNRQIANNKWQDNKCNGEKMQGTGGLSRRKTRCRGCILGPQGGHGGKAVRRCHPAFALCLTQRSVRERGTGGDYPVRPRGNPQPQGVLLSIYFGALLILVGWTEKR